MVVGHSSMKIEDLCERPRAAPLDVCVCVAIVNHTRARATEIRAHLFKTTRAHTCVL